MNTQWNTTPEGRIVLEQQGPLTARLIVGAILGLFGAFFAYATVTGVLEGMRAGLSPGDALISVSVNLIATLFFGVGAFLILLLQARIILDPRTRKIRSIRDFRLFLRQEEYSYDDVENVQIKDESKRERGKMRPNFAVNLVMKKGTIVWIENTPDEADAREFGERVSKALGRNVQEFSEAETVAEEPETTED